MRVRRACRACTGRTTPPRGSERCRARRRRGRLGRRGTRSRPRPSPLPASRIASYVTGVSSTLAGRNGFATPLMTATISWPGSAPPPTRSRTSRNGVPSAISATACRRVAPLTVHTTEPGDASVPSSRNQSAPSARMPATLAIVSTLLASVGGAMPSPPGSASSRSAADSVPSPDLVEAVPPRRCDTREGLPTVEHLEQTGFLTVQVAARTRERAQFDVVGPTGGTHFRDRAFEASAHDREVGFDRDDDLAGFERVRGDQRAFDHAVGVRPQDHAVLERTGLAFGTVHDHRRGVDGRLGTRRRSPTSDPSGTRRRRVPADRTRPPSRSCRRAHPRAPCSARPPPMATYASRSSTGSASRTRGNAASVLIGRKVPPVAANANDLRRFDDRRPEPALAHARRDDRHGQQDDDDGERHAVGMCHQCDTAIFAPTKIRMRPNA